MMKKICSECQIEKDESEFYLRKDTKKYCNKCKCCQAKKSNKYYQDNRYRLKEMNKKWRKLNPDKSNDIYARYRKTDKRKKVVKKWYENNKIKTRDYRNKRYLKDASFNILIKLRARIGHEIRHCNTNKVYKTKKLLGCNFEYLKYYFISMFTDNMSWADFLSGKIHIDHIIPCYLYYLNSLEEQKKCFNYRNIRPLWAKDNLSKNNKFDIDLVKKYQIDDLLPKNFKYIE
jgi:hypothetical protein